MKKKYLDSEQVQDLIKIGILPDDEFIYTNNVIGVTELLDILPEEVDFSGTNYWRVISHDSHKKDWVIKYRNEDDLLFHLWGVEFVDVLSRAIKKLVDFNVKLK